MTEELSFIACFGSMAALSAGDSAKIENNHEWTVKCVPAGEISYRDPTIEFCFAYKGAEKIKAKVDVFILKSGERMFKGFVTGGLTFSHGAERRVSTWSSDENTNSRNSDHYGRLSKRDILSAGVDELKLMFNVSLLSDGDKLLPKSSSIVHNLSALLFNPSQSDVFIVTQDDEKIPAHKLLIVLRSEVFAAMFGSDMAETQSKQIVISDFTSVVVKEMLRFMYTDQCLQMQNHCEELYAIANKYQVLGLMMLCEKYLSSSLTADNAVERLVFADTYSAGHLKTTALAFIVRNFKKVFAATGKQEGQSFFDLVPLPLCQEIMSAMAK